MTSMLTLAESVQKYPEGITLTNSHFRDCHQNKHQYQGNAMCNSEYYELSSQLKNIPAILGRPLLGVPQATQQENRQLQLFIYFCPTSWDCKEIFFCKDQT